LAARLALVREALDGAPFTAVRSLESVVGKACGT
jgi:hypothetical protein